MYQLRKVEKCDLLRMAQEEYVYESIKLLDIPTYIFNRKSDVFVLEDFIFNTGNEICCTIVEEDSNEILGLISLASIDYNNQSATLYIMMQNKKNQAAGRFAIKKMLAHAFYNMDLRRIEMPVVEDDKEILNLYTDYGFTLEGRKRKSLLKHGNQTDVLIYSVLKEEFKCADNEAGNIRIPTWCIEETSNRFEIDNIIRKCDIAFGEYSIIKREKYPALLDKIFYRGHFLFAHQKDIMGYCAIYANDFINRTAYITLIVVRNEFQGKHVGRDLLKRALEIATNYGMDSCVLEVRKNNISAIRFYESNGFEKLNGDDRIYHMRINLEDKD